MQINHRFHRFISWLAILAVLMGALVPTISYAMKTPSAESGWVEVCTANGMKWINTAGALVDSPSSLPSDHHIKHCPYCNLHTDQADLPPAASLSLPVMPFTSLVPDRFLSAHTTLHAWVAVQPRAPPFLTV
ncbi:DUF2946 domain-containing protein [Chitinivorax sp. B]|uniref:DUF2946 domain-containing protein n=1 Tax=Chitinivorax sp. B TaxID=2502235 RepID=UPI0010F4C531|nr:DUF2946 domain-containing protein [Chitinivorax sp. B]